MRIARWYQRPIREQDKAGGSPAVTWDGNADPNAPKLARCGKFTSVIRQDRKYQKGAIVDAIMPQNSQFQAVCSVL